jgi:hypothetical protein
MRLIVLLKVRGRGAIAIISGAGSGSRLTMTRLIAQVPFLLAHRYEELMRYITRVHTRVLEYTYVRTRACTLLGVKKTIVFSMPPWQ